MNLQEFLDRCPKLKTPHVLSEEDWETIQLVYTFHPAISNTEGKDEIVELYCSMGMPFIRAMAPQAITCQLLEEALNRTKTELTKSEESLRAGIARIEKRRDEDIAHIQEQSRFEIHDLKACHSESTKELVVRVQELTDRLGSLEGGR